jgi:hypothetical protein
MDRLRAWIVRRRTRTIASPRGWIAAYKDQSATTNISPEASRELLWRQLGDHLSDEAVYL